MDSPKMTATAYITVVEDDHRVSLPESVPVGTTVVVTVMPSSLMSKAEDGRKARFAAALDLIRHASAKPQADISNAELDALIREARQVRRS
jgi:hypothetical protein